MQLHSHHSQVFKLALFVLALAVAAPGQLIRDIDSHTGLGYSPYTQPSPIHRISDSTFVIVSPSSVTDYAAGVDTSTLLVVRDVWGEVKMDQIGVPDHPGWPHRWLVVMDETTVVLPSPGSDGFWGSEDDELVLVEGLNDPASATVTPCPVGSPGLGGRRNLIRVGPRTLAWVRFLGPDSHYGTGNEVLVVAESIGSQMQVSSTTIGTAGVDRDFVLPLGESTTLLRFVGNDGFLGSVDDAFGIVGRQGDGAVALEMYALGIPIAQPWFGVKWPIATGQGTIAVPDAGPDGSLGNGEDGLTFISGLLDGPVTTMTHLLEDQVPWDWFAGPAGVSVEADGTVILSSSGDNTFMGDSDDSVLAIPGPNSGATEVESMSVGVGLDSPAFIRDAQTQSLSRDGNVSLAPHYGTSFSDTHDDGILVMRREDNIRTFEAVTLFDTVDWIVPMSERSAMVFLRNGAVFHIDRLDEPNIVYEQITVEPWAHLIPPVAISPSTVVSTTLGAASGAFANDTIRAWQVPATWTYGSESTNASSLPLDVGPVGARPELDGTPLFLELSGAPADAPAVLGISLGRASLPVATDATVQIDLTQLVALESWFTNSLGHTLFPIVTPNDPALLGLTLHAQWLVYDASAPRRFELSTGLTVGF